MKFLKLLELVRLFGKMRIRDLLNYPKDLTNSFACREWVRALVDSLQVLAAETDVEFDDKVLDTVESVVENDVAWDAIHGLFVNVIAEENKDIMEDLSISDDVYRAANVHGFNPAIVMIIIQAVSLLLRLFKSRR